MTVKQGVLVLADISGYTRFTRMHFTSLLHAEEIISELLEAVIQAAEFPLQVSQLEGDAVLLFAEVAEGSQAAAARDVAAQVKQLFAAFNTRERALIACDAGCVCDACNQIGQLKLKAALHFGRFSIERIRNIETLTGAEVRLLRAVIKAQLLSPEFILLTPEFYALSGDLEGRAPDRQLDVEVLGQQLRVRAYLPEPQPAQITLPAGAGPAFSGRLNRHAFARMFHLKARAEYSHLAGGSMNLVVYLAEGLSSGLNLLRKAMRASRAQDSREMQIRPVALLLLEVSPDAQAGSGGLEPLAAGLLGSLVERVHLPLKLHKLEGEVAFLYATPDNGDRTVARNLAWQVQELHAEFAAAETHGSLRFRALLHFGRAAFKQVGQFDELAGEDVILIHRLLKNSVSASEYALLTESFYRLSGGMGDLTAQARVESAEGLGDVPVRVFVFPRSARENPLP